MALTFEHKEYSPSALAKVLSEEYGHKVTPSVVRKWDNVVYSSIVDKKRGDRDARTYTNEDVLIFNAIATLRELGYSLKDVKSIISVTHSPNSSSTPDIVTDTGTKKIAIEIKHHVDKRKKGYEQLIKYLDQMNK